MLLNVIKIFTKNDKEPETLIQTIRIFSQDMGMEIEIEKGAMLIIKIGKRERMKVSKREKKKNKKNKTTKKGKEK